MKRGLLATIALVAAASTAHAEAYVRVLAQSASVRTGPAPTYREIFVAPSDAQFQVLERATIGYWFRILLDDGTTGWIDGNSVYPLEMSPAEAAGFFARVGDGIQRHLLGPSPVPTANVQVSFSAGTLDGEGVYLLRPSVFIDPSLAIEFTAGLSPRGDKDVFLGNAGLTLRLAPGAAIGPYIHGGVGAAYIRPRADNFVDVEQTLMTMAFGGGLEITLKKQITVRLDCREWTLFDQNQITHATEFSAGLSIFF